nr:retrovirus-related Pol polyprotein from transposon TNT 1-94 [Tanacetum cinerariifolium]
MVQKSGIQCYNCKEYGHIARECQKPKRAKDAAYHWEKMLLCKQEEAGIQLNAEQAEMELECAKVRDAQSMLIESEDMNYDSEQIEQNDEDVDLAKERELLASLISKLKCEIDETKKRNTLLETSNKVLVEKLKSEIADFKTKHKSLSEANNKLSEVNAHLYADYKKSKDELKRRNTVEYATEMELECAKLRGELISNEMERKRYSEKDTHEPSYNQNYNNYYPHELPSFSCYNNCGGSHETFQCQPIDQNVDFSGSDQIQTLQYPDVHPPSQEINEEDLHAKEDLMKYIQNFVEEFNCIPFEEKPPILLEAWFKFFAIKRAQPEDSNELFQKLLEDLKELAE